MDYQAAVSRFSDWRWRLNNLYWIVNKRGKRQKFEMNWAQEALFNQMHYQNVILKARQLGFTTFIQLFMLDVALFNTDIRAGTIAHTLDDAKVIFRDKVKFPYDNLPDGLKSAIPIINDNATELMLKNNSSIRVGTSLRSGTLQYLHISEYGKICAKFPEKAREIRTGALNTIQAGQLVFIESTAEGQEGHFFDICEAAQAQQRTGAKLSELDFKFHFYPWWKNDDYEVDPSGVVVPQEYADYFDKLRQNEGIDLSARKKAWYVAKARTQGAEMKREYPSTPKEAFEAAVEGAYYADQISRAELEGRIGTYSALPNVPVHTAWDIGRGDYTAIWFFQIFGKKICFISYYQNNNEGAAHYMKKLHEMALKNGWKYGNHYLPHDVKVTEWGSDKSRIERLVEGIKLDSGERFSIIPKIVTELSIEDGINAVKEVFPFVYMDEASCSQGLKGLKNYRKEWDEDASRWRDSPFHNWASDPADSFRYACISYREEAASKKPPEKLGPTLNDLWNSQPRRRERV